MEEVNSRCRLCGRKEENDKKFQDIFEGDQSLDLPRKINKLLPILVIKWDPLPHGICNPCIEQLNKIDKFYDDTLKVDKHLRSLLPYTPKMNLENISPIIKIENFNRIYGNYFKMIENSEDYKNNVKIESEDRSVKEKIQLQTEQSDTDAETDYNESPQVVISADESQDSPILIDSSPKKSPLVDLTSTDEPVTAPNKSPTKSPLVDLSSTNEPSSESTSAESPKKSSLDNVETIFGPSSVESLKSSPPLYKPPESAEPEVIDLVDLDEPTEPTEPAIPPVPGPRRTLDCFLIRYVLNIPKYSCRQCYRTFLIAGPALDHICEETKSPEKEDSEEKKLPPLKIRVSTSSNGKYICEFCKLSFNRKTALQTHLKSLHYNSQDVSDFSEEIPIPKKKKKRVKSRDSAESGDSNKSKRRKYVDNLEKIWREVKPNEGENSRPNNYPENNGALNDSVPNKHVRHKNILNSKEKEDALTENNSFLICDVCDDIFLTRNILDEHKKIHSKVTPGVSPLSDEKRKNIEFTSDEDHPATVDVSGPSDENQENVGSIYDLTSDEESEKGGSCRYCDKMFISHKELDQHQRKHLAAANIQIDNEKKSGCGEDMDVYICESCSVSFDRKSAYIAHKKIHDAERLDDTFYERMKEFDNAV